MLPHLKHLYYLSFQSSIQNGTQKRQTETKNNTIQASQINFPYLYFKTV